MGSWFNPRWPDDLFAAAVKLPDFWKRLEPYCIRMTPESVRDAARRGVTWYAVTAETLGEKPVCQCAKQSCDCVLTPEERAVIEAAEREMDEMWALPRRDAYHCHPAVLRTMEAVRALRESRKPKPRYRMENSGMFCQQIVDSRTNKALTNAEITRLLNEAESK